MSRKKVKVRGQARTNGVVREWESVRCAGKYRQSGGLPGRPVVLRKGYRIIDHPQ